MMTKICAECGLPFETNNSKKKFCDRKHFRKCVICGSMFEVTRYHLTAKDAKVTCSKQCSAQLRKQTNIAKYGGVAPACSSSVQEKMQSTTQSRLGVKHAAQSSVCKQKSIDTCIEKYGVSHPSKTHQAKKQLSERWRNRDFRDSVAESKLRASMLKYGTENPMQTKEVRNRCVASKMTDSSKYELFQKFKEDTRNTIQSLHLDSNPTLYQLSELLGVNTSTVGHYIHMNKCEDLVSFYTSLMEQQVTEFILTLLPDVEIQHNVRSLISPYELDLYIPAYKLAIECNPTATHNSTVNVFDKSLPPLLRQYHCMKTDRCDKIGVRLLHVFGYEWTHKQDVIKSIIANALRCNAHVVYARQCEVRNVDPVTSRRFLNDNHRQGAVGGSVRLGLYHAGDLVAIMTFGKMRKTIGGCEDTSATSRYELLRFCCKQNTSVVGGASKLFKHFLKTYEPTVIRSFSDKAHTTGNLYQVLGFKEVRRSDAGYVWVNLKDDRAYNRVNAQKANIQKFLHDDNIDMHKSEACIMQEHGYVQVFDSGTITWEWSAL